MTIHEGIASRTLKLTLIIAVFCSLSTRTSFAESDAPASRPNLLIIQTDEHHYGTLGCYGNSMFAGEGSLTPNIDRLAAEGALATSFYATTPVCSPSRASLMSGKYPQATPVVQNDIQMSGQITSFADVLKSAGYATGYCGKWHLDGDGKPEWAPQRNFGWSDNRYMFNRGHWKKLISTENGPAVGGTDNRGRPSYNLNNADEKTFTTDWLTDRAIEFIEENGDQPFCYMVSLPDPHGPNTVRAPYDTMYSADDVVIPESLTNRPRQIPIWGYPDRGVTAASLRQFMPKYFGMVKCIDDNIGRLIELLEEKEIMDETIIVFTSDHGDLCGEHGKVNKGNPYEGSARIPFVIRYPEKIPAGTQVDVALSCIDFFPTILNLMNAESTVTPDGRDAAPLFTGQTDENWDDVAILRSTQSNQLWLCAVSDDHKLVLSSHDKPWFFDLQEDPHELTNRIGDPQYAMAVSRLAVAIRDYAKEHNDPYVRNSRIRYYLSQLAQEPELVEVEFFIAEAKAAEGLIPKVLQDATREQIYLHAEPCLSNAHIAKAENASEDRGIEMTFTKEGAEIMSTVTGENIGKRLAILVDGKLIMAPYIRSQISDKAVLIGNFTAQEITRILASLNAPAN